MTILVEVESSPLTKLVLLLGKKWIVLTKRESIIYVGKYMKYGPDTFLLLLMFYSHTSGKLTGKANDMP